MLFLMVELISRFSSSLGWIHPRLILSAVDFLHPFKNFDHKQQFAQGMGVNG